MSGEAALFRKLEFGDERVVVAGFEFAFFYAEGPQGSAIEYLVQMKPIGVQVICDERAESGLDICVLEILALEQTVGIRFRNIVEVSAYDHGAFHPVDCLAQYLYVMFAFLERRRHLFAYAAFQLVQTVFGPFYGFQIGHHIAFVSPQVER